MGLSSLDCPPQPVEIDLNSSRTLPNPSAPASLQWDQAVYPSQGLGDMLCGGSLPRMSSIIASDGPARGPLENPIWQWYAGNDGPWNPTRVVTESAVDDRSLFKQASNRYPGAHSGQYRQQNPAGSVEFQFGVPHSDSGYGTRRSVGTTSVFSSDVHERDQDTHSMVASVPDFPPFQGNQKEILQQRDSRNSWTSPCSQILEPINLVCPTCEKPVKTQSELKYGPCSIDLSNTDQVQEA